MPYINKKPIGKDNKPHVKRSSNSSRYYNDKRWKILRHSYMNSHPLCADCAAEGRSVPAEEVHHKVPFLTGITDEDRWNLLLDENNLVALCKECHLKRHGKVKR